MSEKTAEKCSWTGCALTSGARFEERALCLEHFLEYSSRRITLIERAFEGDSGERNSSPKVLSFLSQVISQTTVLATETKRLAPLYRYSLILLSTRAAEIYKQIQRMPRIARRIACKVSTGTAAKEIPEACCTVNVSIRGACLELKQALRMEQTISLERTDVPRKPVRARVAWIKQMTLGRFVVGVEILGEEDFWELGKTGNRGVGELLGAVR